MSGRRACVVLTACVDPSAGRGTPLVARADPRQRLEDYKTALRFWLELPEPRVASVLVVENSGYPLDALRAVADAHNLHGRAVEVGHYADNFTPEGVSYGYPELAMLDDASARSPLWRDADLLVKATGRLTFPAFPRLLRKAREPFDFLADAADARTPPWRKRSVEHGEVRTQLMLFTPAFYDAHLRGVRHAMRPVPGHRLIENVLWRHLLPLHEADPARVRLRFPANCPPRGEAAHWQRTYGSPRDRAVELARGVARVVVPGWWL